MLWLVVEAGVHLFSEKSLDPDSQPDWRDGLHKRQATSPSFLSTSNINDGFLCVLQRVCGTALQVSSDEVAREEAAVALGANRLD